MMMSERGGSKKRRRHHHPMHRSKKVGAGARRKATERHTSQPEQAAISLTQPRRKHKQASDRKEARAQEDEPTNKKFQKLGCCLLLLIANYKLSYLTM
jgi:hypothetical protein